MRWSNEQSAFALEAYFSNGSVVSTQRAFRNRFNIAPLGPVPDRKSIHQLNQIGGWGYLKSRVYTNRPQTLDDLKRNIQEETANIPIDVLERVIRNSRIRFNQCIDNGGRHLPDMIFKTM